MFYFPSYIFQHNPQAFSLSHPFTPLLSPISHSFSLSFHPIKPNGTVA